MSKSIRAKEKYANKGDVPDIHSNDGTAARTRPFSFSEIMLRRKNKKQPGGVEDPRTSLEVVVGKGTESISSRVESGRQRHGDTVGGTEQHDFKESRKANSRKKDDKASMREGKIIKGEEKDSNDSQRMSRAGGDYAKVGKKETHVREKRKNDDRSSDDSDNDHRNRNTKDAVLRDRDRYDERNRRKYEHVSKRRNQNGDDERTRDPDTGKKHELRKLHDSEISERKEKKETLEPRHEDSKSKRRRSRSREHDRDKRRSVSPSSRGRKHRSYDTREYEELSLHSPKDKFGRFDSNIDKKRISSNGSSNKSRRHDASASRLGGYSPRKRRSEAAVKTPSPASRSPEKKTAGWDFPPVKTESKYPSSFQSDLKPLSKTEQSKKSELSGVVPINSTSPKVNDGILSSTHLKINASVDSIQLTQATRPKRRLYVENLPSSTSEDAVMEWLNGHLLRSRGINHIQGTRPCISCIVHKEKGQALVEFLTPEDASTALSFDGKSFSGNILKIRRPKDYIEVTTDVSEKPVAAAASVRDFVEDSPYKIFIGGISKVITSEMLMEIASAFGPLKGYYFKTDVHDTGPCAFLEYVDPSVTLKACAGLNGMKLGGQVLTVVQANPDASSVENPGLPPSYGIPEHARSLLQKPTQVLKLNNVLNSDILSSLSEPELEEILEDIRLECTRFGMVKSINIIKHTNMPTCSETVEASNNDSVLNKVSDVGSMALDLVNTGASEPTCSVKEKLEEVAETADGNMSHDDKPDASDLKGAAGANGINDKEPVDKLVKNEICDNTMVDGVIDQNLEDYSNQMKNVQIGDDEMELKEVKPIENVQIGDCEMENESLVKVNLKLEEGSVKLEMSTPKPELGNGEMAESSDVMKDENEGEVSDPKDVFEHGCVLVEYRREEASSMAAHCLHGRLFDGRIVSVEYVAHDIYRARFPK